MAPQLPALTKASEDRLMTALDDLHDSIGMSDEDPTKEAAKAICKHNVPPQHIPHLVHAYNTGQTRMRRDLGTDRESRLAPFKLADEDRIKEALYSHSPRGSIANNRGTSKTAAAVVDMDYSRPPLWLKKEPTYGQQLLAAAVAETRVKAAAAVTPPRIENSIDPLRDVSIALAHAKQAVLAAESRLMRQHAQLVDGLKQSAAPALHQFAENIRARHGDGPATVLMREVVRVAPELVKRPVAFKYASATGPLYQLVADMLTAAVRLPELHTAVTEKQAAYNVAEKAQAERLGHLRPDPGYIHPFIGKIASADITPEIKAADGLLSKALSFSPTGSVAKGVFDVGKTMAGAGEMGGEMKSRLSPATASDDPADALLRHDAEMNAIHRESVLHDLMSNDPVISNHDPRQVVEAFQEFTALAPQASLQRGVMTDFLRKRLDSGQTSYFDLKTLTEIEKNIVDARKTTQGLK